MPTKDAIAEEFLLYMALYHTFNQPDRIGTACITFEDISSNFTLDEFVALGKEKLRALPIYLSMGYTNLVTSIHNGYNDCVRRYKELRDE